MTNLKVPTTQVKALKDRIIVYPIDFEQISRGGIILINQEKKGYKTGVVIAAGPGRQGEPMPVKVGDKVMYGEHAGLETTVDGELDGNIIGLPVLFMKDLDILAIINY